MSKVIGILVTFIAVYSIVVSSSFAMECGNGIVEGVEECDTGAARCDSCPNACRTDCSLPHCGDDTVDAGEECDDGNDCYGSTRNSDEIPGACRMDCQLAHCGDGVLDPDEECDDANQGAFDGCHECSRCISLADDLVVAGREDQTLLVCPGYYEFQDKGQEGVIVLNSHGMTLDCQGATIRGHSAVTAAGSQSMPAFAKVASQPNRPLSRKAVKQGATAEAAPASTPPANPTVYPPSGPAATLRYGTGIVVAADNIVLRNCNVTNFRTGVKVQSTGSVLLDNNVCGNQTDIVAVKPGSYGVKNYCTTPSGWSENGSPGCTFSCP
jgi:cysteine-rich repeat protein